MDIMLATGLCVFLKVLALAGSVSALLPEDLEDPAPVNLQEECASKCPDLDLNQVGSDNLLVLLWNLKALWRCRTWIIQAPYLSRIFCIKDFSPSKL